MKTSTPRKASRSTCGCHLAYLLASRMIPSSDEAHYMSGVYGIAAGLESGSLKTAFASYSSALGFKAALICVPAALIMLAVENVILASKLSLVLIFVGLGMASYKEMLRSIHKSCDFMLHLLSD